VKIDSLIKDSVEIPDHFAIIEAGFPDPFPRS
jgi:hypothetical protein